jgi:hypothetical protein
MTDLEQRLRRDLQGISQRADAGSIRPLRDPPARRRPAAVRWLAPVTAVAAVLGVVAGVSLASRSQGHRPAPLQSPIPPEPAGPMPPFYVTLAATYPQNAPWAYVRDSATGAVLTAVHLPVLVTNYGSSSPSITAGDDRTYIITVSGSDHAGKATTTGAPGGVIINRYYLMRVAADGRAANLSLLHIPLSPHATDGIALSPDGSKVATAVQSCRAGGCQYTGIQVVTLATGASRTWTTQADGAPFSVSWVGSGHLAFDWQGRAASGYRVLDITRPGSNLLAAQPMAGPPPVATGFVPPALFTSDGRAVITSTVRNIPEGSGRDTVIARIVELDANTGQLLQVLHTVIARNVTTQRDTTQTSVTDLDQTCKVVSLGPAGVHALVQCFGFGRVDGTRFTPLPGVPNPNANVVSGSDYWGTGAW